MNPTRSLPYAKNVHNRQKSCHHLVAQYYLGAIPQTKTGGRERERCQLYFKCYMEDTIFIRLQ